MTVTTRIPDRELLGRAVKSARSRVCHEGERHLRWVAVMDFFAVGSTYARELCRMFGLDPDEEVAR